MIENQTPSARLSRRANSSKRGFSLIEVIVTMTILAVLLSFTAPSVVRTLEQTHADMAGAGLRMVNTAQRFYWLDNRTYATTLQELIDAGLIDADLGVAAPRYEFSIVSADSDSFDAQARRRLIDNLGNPVYDGAWQGTYLIDETGVITGTVNRSDNSVSLSPAF